MSLILDALRKSEHQRQRQLGPGLAVVAEGGSGHRPPAWILVLGALLALNILVVVALLTAGRETRTVAAATAPAAAPVAPAASRAEPLQAAPVTLPSRPPTRSEVRPLTTEVATAPAAAPGAPPASAPRQPAAAAAGGRAAEEARLPRFADMVIRGELNVPHMHLDIHVYSDNPAERFVFINMRRYDEGQATQEGPRVERITRDGVVMDHQSRRFFLPRD